MNEDLRKCQEDIEEIRRNLRKITLLVVVTIVLGCVVVALI